MSATSIPELFRGVKREREERVAPAAKKAKKKITPLQQLQQNGYAIVPELFDAAESLKIMEGLWEHIEHITYKLVDRKDPLSWRNHAKFFPSHGMLHQHFGIGQSQVAWDVRQNPKVRKVFADIWGTDNLAVSFDGASFSLPPEVTNRGWHTKDWYHLDQATARNDLESVQGWVTGEDVEEGDATLTLLKGSHLKHAEFAKKFDLQKLTANWYKLTQEQVDWYKQECERVDVVCPKGSLVLWDSRTVHAGKGPVKGRSNSTRQRGVVYVCMTPARLLTPALIRKRQNIVLAKRTSSHWPHRPKLFGVLPRTYNSNVKIPPVAPVPYPVLTEQGAKLASFTSLKDYETKRNEYKPPVKKQ